MFFVRQSLTAFQPPLWNQTADIFLLLICATAVKMRDFGKMPVSFFAGFITERGGLAAEPLQQLNCQHRTECQSHYSTDHANRQRRN